MGYTDIRICGNYYFGSALYVLCEPLGKLVEGKKDWLPRNGMFFVENLFEMFEVILSFFTNTISFLRIGAFAIVHVGMMMVVAISFSKRRCRRSYCTSNR